MQRWETMAVDTLNDSVKRQIIMEQSPQQIRTQLTLQGHRSYDNLRTAVLSYMVSSRDWSGATSAASGVPMEVDAWTQAGHCGDRRGKDGTGKGDHKGTHGGRYTWESKDDKDGKVKAAKCKKRPRPQTPSR